MIKQNYALYDSTLQVFLNPLSFTNDGEAIRWFTTVVNNTQEETNLNKYPEQFSLWRVADYNDKTGMYQPRDTENSGDPSQTPTQIITGNQVKEDKDKLFTIEQLKDMFKEEINNVIKLKQEA